MLEESKLIFIISQPRAGSTLLQKVISNNKWVDTVSEPWLLLPFLSIYRPELVEATYNFSVMATGVKDYLSKKKLEPAFRAKLKELILSMYQVTHEGQYFLDKTPRYYEILPEIYALFPNAKYIILKRNPFASLSSMLHTWSGGLLLFDKIRTFYRDFFIGPFKIQEFHDIHINNSNVFEIKYESLVKEPDKLTEKIYEWLNIPYNEEVLKIGSNTKVSGIYGDDVYKKTIQADISVKNAENWKSTCNHEPLKSFFIEYNRFLGNDFIKKYGYEPLDWKKSFFNKNDHFERFLKQPDIHIN